MPLAFYLKNLPAKRIGEYSDAKIKDGLRKDGFIVIDVDCSAFPRTSPELEDALVQFHASCPSVYALYENAQQKVDVTNIFYVPEGYTVTRDIPVWNILEHGAPGSAQWVMDSWNSHIVPRYGKEPVASPEQMHNPDGTPIDWNLYMDVVHPSGMTPERVPLLLIYGSITPRMASFRPDRPLDRVYRNIFPFGFLTTGYAFAITDHGYNPLCRKWGHFKQYTLDAFNGRASSTAFIRYLRSHADRYNLDGRIGTMGISKASYSSVRAAEAASGVCEGESLLLGGVVSDRPQPWQGVPEHADVAYVAAGIGAERAFRHITSESAPLITSAGMSDEYRQWEVYPEVVRHLSSIDHIHLSLWMEDMGHTFPCMGVDQATGEDRYVLFKRFFDHYLKGGSADVFYILPKEGASDVDCSGASRILPCPEHMPGRLPDSMLPSAMGYFSQTYEFARSYAGMMMRVATGEQKYVLFKDFFDRYIGRPGNFLVLAQSVIFPENLPQLEAEATITVRFLTEYAVDEVQDKVSVREVSTGMLVKGTWMSSMKGTCFHFVPDSPLTVGGRYMLTVPSSLRSVSGKAPLRTVTRFFNVAGPAL